MPVSQGTGGGMPGMGLKAWALVTSAGAIIKSFNVSAYAATADGAGYRKVTFATPMTTLNYLAKWTPMGVPGMSLPVAGYINTSKPKNLGDCVVTMGQGGAGNTLDPGGLWEFYE